MRLRKRKTGNPLGRYAKLSEYKYRQVIQCFADDLSIKEAAAKTKISERSIRDMYDGLRQRMVGYALTDESLFGGVKNLFLDRQDKLEKHVLAALINLSKTAPFKERIKRLYPRTNPATQPMLLHAMEYSIRQVIRMHMTPLDDEGKEKIGKALDGAAGFVSLLLQLGGLTDEQGEKLYWNAAKANLDESFQGQVRKLEPQQNDALVRDLRLALRAEPL